MRESIWYLQYLCFFKGSTSEGAVGTPTEVKRNAPVRGPSITESSGSSCGPDAVPEVGSLITVGMEEVGPSGRVLLS